MRGVLAVIAAAALLLSGCTTTRELKTASDQTAQEKRAAIRMQLAISYYQDAKYAIALDEIKQAITIEIGRAHV